MDPEEDLRPVIQAYEGVIEERAQQLHAAGHLSSLYADEPFDRRIASIAAEAPEVGQDELGKQRHVFGNSLDIYRVRHPAMFRFLRNPKLLDTVESLVGGEILCHPTQHLRAVLPTSLKDLTRTVDWHQDAAVLRRRQMTT